jgi:hypothetical protein
MDRAGVSANGLSKQLSMPQTTLSSQLRRRAVPLDVLERAAPIVGVGVEDLLSPPVENGGEPEEADMGDRLEAMAREGREADAEAWYLRALERIESLDGTDEDRRMLYRDSVASAYGRVGYVLAERAGFERAAAVREAESAGKERAATVRREKKTAPVILGTARGERGGKG